MITEIETAWFAGLVEGEGWIAWAKYGDTYSAVLVVNMTDRDVIERCAALTGATVGVVKRKNRPDHHLEMYRIQLRGTRAIAWMAAIYPYLGERRRAKIREVMAAWKEVPVTRKPVLTGDEPRGFMPAVNAQRMMVGFL